MDGTRDRMARRQGGYLAALALISALAVLAPGKAAAGSWPNLLDDNRSSGYSVVAQALSHLLGPFACHVPVCKVQAGGRVVANPKVVNLFWGDNWDAHNTKSPTRAQINAAVQLVSASEYLDNANQTSAR